MRYLVLSDIHGNIDALEATLQAAAGVGYDRTLVLGDLVGYGADPAGVIDSVRALHPEMVIRGNHDKAVAGQCDIDHFNRWAQEAVLWTRTALDAAHLAYLADLPSGPVCVGELLEVCHGSPVDEDAYIFDAEDATAALDVARRPVCLCGHTHLACLVSSHDGRMRYDELLDGDVIDLLEESAYLVNVGSVGQPRDGDPRAGFAIVDTSARTLAFRRIDYAVSAAQERIMRAGLPERLALRLAGGR
jgi:diadenosine tetraphosphatase ApaH/serine/threonine PP2A family protein phosphatase